MDISLSCTLSQSVSAPPQHNLRLVQLYKMKCSSHLVSILQPPHIQLTQLAWHIVYEVTTFLRFNCPWTNVDISIHCIMSYYKVLITLLLYVPCFSLSCIPMQFVSGQEKPVKHNLQP